MRENVDANDELARGGDLVDGFAWSFSVGENEFAIFCAEWKRVVVPVHFETGRVVFAV